MAIIDIENKRLDKGNLMNTEQTIFGLLDEEDDGEIKQLLDNRPELYHIALCTFGLLGQLDVATEEMAELIKELSKFKRGEDNLHKIAEEVADVEIMLEQIKQYFDFNKDYMKEVKNKKLNKLLGHIRKEKTKLNPRKELRNDRW